MSATPSVPPGRTTQAERALKRFTSTVQRSIAAAKKRVALNILVWGQNPNSGSSLALKRIDIQAKLLAEGHNAMFSEELTNNLDPTLSEKSKEFYQALEADLVVILIEEAPGASAEAHDFCNHPDIAPKCKVMVPKRYQAGYSAQGAIADLQNAHGGVFWYEPDDLTQCHLLTHIVGQAEAMRQARVIYGNKSS